MSSSLVDSCSPGGAFMIKGLRSPGKSIVRYQGSPSGRRRWCRLVVSSSSAEIPGVRVDRRELVFAASLAAGVTLLPGQRAGADPVELGSLSSCSQAELPAGAGNCCPPPSSSTVTDFRYNKALPMRTRQAAHLVSSDDIAKYAKACELMRSLPSSDPRSFKSQANVHCAYCGDAFLQADGSSRLQIHNSWLFLPWHRWYLYFHERILGSLIGDDSFALPYWNWDNQSTASPPGNVIPAMYLDNASLGDRLRNPRHLPPRIVDLNYNGVDGGRVRDSTLRAENNALMYQQVVSGARTASLFHGQAYRGGDSQAPGGGTLENAPHGPVHVWTGNNNQPNFEDMGALYSAARDPIFFAHHANIDRIWSVWKTLPGGRRRDFTDPDWVNAKFLFYDEEKRLVRVRVGDALETEQLGYAYEKSADAWKTARPSVLGRASGGVVSGIDSPGSALAVDVQEEIEEFGESVAGKLKKLEGVFRTKVKRPLKNKMKKMKRKAHDEEEEEVLVIEGVEVDCNKASKFDVYINLPEADEGTPCGVVEYVGTFVNVPHYGVSHGNVGGESEMVRKVDVRLGIGETLELLGVKDEHVVVSIVPRGSAEKEASVSFKGFRIEYE